MGDAKNLVFVANWKLNKSIKEAVIFARGMERYSCDRTVIIAPPFTALCTVGDFLALSDIKLAGQDCFWEEEGAYTGEISPGMLLDAGCSHVIIGHSERRQYFGETDETVNKKINAALKVGLVVIFCVGETLAQREEEKTFGVLREQVTVGLAGIDKKQLNNIIIAYEPVWAIGTGKTATNEQAQEVHAFIRTIVAELFDQTAGNDVYILYGGSVKPDNVAGLMSQPDIDGALVGGASLNVGSFDAIVNFDS